MTLIFRPICPQVSTDFHHLLRIPESVRSQEPCLEYDEFRCLNLDVTVPGTPKRNMPVMIWIHGELSSSHWPGMPC